MWRLHRRRATQSSRESASDYAIWPAAHERLGKIDARRLAAYMPAHERFPYELCRRQAPSPY